MYTVGFQVHLTNTNNYIGSSFSFDSSRLFENSYVVSSKL